MRINQRVHFLLRSEQLTAAEITAGLLMEPDRIEVRGSLRPDPPVPPCHGWSISAPVPDQPVNDQLDALIQRLEPFTTAIGRLVATGQVVAILRVVRRFAVLDDAAESCPVAAPRRLLGWWVDEPILRFLADTGATVDVDERGHD